MARELHDIVGRAFNVVVIQTAGARRAFDTRPDVAHDTLASIDWRTLRRLSKWISGFADWTIDKDQAQRISQPALVVLGGDSPKLHPRFEETYQLLLDWLPSAEAACGRPLADRRRPAAPIRPRPGSVLVLDLEEGTANRSGQPRPTTAGWSVTNQTYCLNWPTRRKTGSRSLSNPEHAVLQAPSASVGSGASCRWT
jgi:Histidine kinase